MVIRDQFLERGKVEARGAAHIFGSAECLVNCGDAPQDHHGGVSIEQQVVDTLVEEVPGPGDPDDLGVEQPAVFHAARLCHVRVHQFARGTFAGRLVPALAEVGELHGGHCCFCVLVGTVVVFAERKIQSRCLRNGPGHSGLQPGNIQRTGDLDELPNLIHRAAVCQFLRVPDASLGGRQTHPGWCLVLRNAGLVRGSGDRGVHNPSLRWGSVGKQRQPWESGLPRHGCACSRQGRSGARVVLGCGTGRWQAAVTGTGRSGVDPAHHRPGGDR